MKSIKLILLSVLAAMMLTACGTNNSTKATPTPKTNQSTGNVSNTDNGTVSQDVKDTGNAAGNAVKDVGDAAGNVVDEAGNAAGDVVEGVGDAASDMTGSNNTNTNTKQ